MYLSIDTGAAAKYSKTLQKIGKQALPNAIREALNSAAFDVKKTTMPKHANDEFVNRQPNFFKANSRVEMAKGIDIKNMRSIVGFVEGGLKGGSNYAVKDLEQQEEGGTIAGKSLIPMSPARTGNSSSRMVTARNRLANIGKFQVINADKVRFKQSYWKKSQRFIRAAIVAKREFGKDAYVLGNKRNDGSQTLSRIDRLVINKDKGTLTIKRTPLYTYRKNRKIQVPRTNFMKRASLESGMSLERYYTNAAIKQIKKLQKQ